MRISIFAPLLIASVLCSISALGDCPGDLGVDLLKKGTVIELVKPLSLGTAYSSKSPGIHTIQWADGKYYGEDNMISAVENNATLTIYCVGSLDTPQCKKGEIPPFKCTVDSAIGDGKSGASFIFSNSVPVSWPMTVSNTLSRLSELPEVARGPICPLDNFFNEFRRPLLSLSDKTITSDDLRKALGSRWKIAAVCDQGSAGHNSVTNGHKIKNLENGESPSGTSDKKLKTSDGAKVAPAK